MYRGKLVRVWDNETKSGKKVWKLVIDTDEKGEVSFSLFDKKLAGIDSENNPAECDCHDFIGERVVFSATAGKVRDEATGERWPSTIDMIAREIEREGPEIDFDAETVEEPTKATQDDLTRLAMDMINAIGKWATEIERRTK